MSQVYVPAVSQLKQGPAQRTNGMHVGACGQHKYDMQVVQDFELVVQFAGSVVQQSLTASQKGNGFRLKCAVAECLVKPARIFQNPVVRPDDAE